MEDKVLNSWQLKTERGRQRWQYTGNFDEITLKAISEAFIYNKKTNPNSGDKIYRQLQTASFHPKTDNQIPNPGELNNEFAKQVFRSGYKAVDFYQQLQAEEGHWPGDYGGPMFLLPGLVIASYITDTPFPAPQQELMKRYMLNHQNEDGGWGLHLEGRSTMFGTTLQYVSLRIMGAKSDAPEIVKARKWIINNGGAIGIPSWGKFYLSVLGIYEWGGCNSLFPEMWLLPKWAPIHPSRYWCHCRMVYLPMAYCYGHKVTGKKTELVEELRKEIYVEDYDSINWSAARDKCAAPDLYFPGSKLLKVLNGFLNLYEKAPLKYLRKKALDFTLSYVNAEDDHTNYIDIGPVNKVINSICVWHAYGKDSEPFKKHVERWSDYLWLAEDGLKMSGYNGSQLWDTAFAAQAILEGGFENYFPETIEKAYHYIDISQVKQEVRERGKFFRHPSVGGWPFSTLDHGWPITDCTSEGLKATVAIHESNLKNQKKEITDERLKQATDVILSLQNKDGGWASYELTRAPAWIELLNPSELFGNIMVDYSYTECSSACIQALVKARKCFPDYRTREVDKAIRGGIEFIYSQQREDGSWYGSWAVCFTYGMWFAIEAIKSAEDLIDKSEARVAISRGCAFLLSKQNADGGWGESFESCVQKKYIPHQNSQVVNTAWALLSLMAAGHEDKAAIEKGIHFLMERQQATGDWEQESVSGVFNHNCMITYTAYRNVFPIWALGRYLKFTAD